MNRFLRLRKFYDWFNNCSYLNILLDGSNSTNEPLGGGLVYFSPIGKSEDLVVTERYFDQEYYINELKNENPLLRKSCLMRLSMSEYELKNVRILETVAAIQSFFMYFVLKCRYSNIET